MYRADDIMDLLEGKQAELKTIIEKEKAGGKLSELEAKIRRTVEATVKATERREQLVKSIGKADRAGAMKVFRVDFDQILHILKLERREGLRYSFDEIGPGWSEIAKRAKQGRERIKMKDPNKPADIIAIRAIELDDHLQTFVVLSQLGGLRLVPDATFSPKGWSSMFDALHAAGPRGKPLEHLVRIVAAYAMGDAKEFNSQVAAYSELAREHLPEQASTARQEAWFNHFAPFYRCAVLYVLVFLPGRPVVDGRAQGSAARGVLLAGVRLRRPHPRPDLPDVPPGPAPGDQSLLVGGCSSAGAAPGSACCSTGASTGTASPPPWERCSASAR